MIYPKAYFDKVSDISLEFLNENKIKGLILDVDNTLIDYYRNMSDEVVTWTKKLKENGISLYILSNSNNTEKVTEVAKKLDLEYSIFATKPLKRGFKKAIQKLNLEPKNIAAVGDQIFTDVMGANRCGIYPILVKPIAQKDIFITKVKRPIEQFVINRYLSKKEKK